MFLRLASNTPGRTFDFDRARALRKPYQLKLNAFRRRPNSLPIRCRETIGSLVCCGSCFPKAKFIHCTRHPVDTCLSIYMTAFNTPPNYASDPEKLVFTYRLYRQIMESLVYDPWETPEFMKFHYEALIENPGR